MGAWRWPIGNVQMPMDEKPHALMRAPRYRAGWELDRIYQTKDEADYWAERLSDFTFHEGAHGPSLDGWAVCPADEIEAFISTRNAALGLEKV
jgi:hypothetical protein